jgi:hypothetical protein
MRRFVRKVLVVLDTSGALKRRTKMTDHRALALAARARVRRFLAAVEHYHAAVRARAATAALID